VVSNGYALHSVQGQSGLTHPFYFYIRALWRPAVSVRMPKIKKKDLDQYGAEHFGELIFATIRKKCGTERVKLLSQECSSEVLENGCFR